MIPCGTSCKHSGYRRAGSFDPGGSAALQTNPVRRFASVLGSLLGCFLLIALFMVQLRYMGYESGLVPVAHADTSADVAYASSSPRSTVTAEYCSEVVAALDPANPSGRTSTQMTFDDSWSFRDARTYQHDLATACSVLAAVCNSESQYYDGVAGSVPYAERTLGALGFHDVRTESYAMRSSILMVKLVAGGVERRGRVHAGGQASSEQDHMAYGANGSSNFNFFGQARAKPTIAVPSRRGEVEPCAPAPQAGRRPGPYAHPSRDTFGGAIAADLLAADLDVPED